MKTDKEIYLEHWGYTGEEAEIRWADKLAFDNRQKEKLYSIIPDIEPYESPIDGRVINSRTQRRDDLERHNARPYEGREQEAKEAKRRESYIEQRNDAQLTEHVSRAYYQLSPSKRDALRRR